MHTLISCTFQCKTVLTLKFAEKLNCGRFLLHLSQKGKGHPHGILIHIKCIFNTTYMHNTKWNSMQNNTGRTHKWVPDSKIANQCQTELPKYLKLIWLVKVHEVAIIAAQYCVKRISYSWKSLGPQTHAPNLLSWKLTTLTASHMWRQERCWDEPCSSSMRLLANEIRLLKAWSLAQPCFRRASIDTL